MDDDNTRSNHDGDGRCMDDEDDSSSGGDEDGGSSSDDSTGMPVPFFF